MPSPPDITQILLRARGEGSDGLEEVFPLVYHELHRMAHRRLRASGAHATLNTTALVHEAYLKLVDQAQVDWQDRTHFFAVAARAMRFILIDYARARQAEKRGGGRAATPLSEVQLAAQERIEALLALDEALDGLAAQSERLARLVEYRFFGGFTYDEIAQLMGCSVATAKRDWARARAWLYRAMRTEAAPTPDA